MKYLDILTNAPDRTNAVLQYLEQSGISIITTADLNAIFDRIKRQAEEIDALEFRIATLLGDKS